MTDEQKQILEMAKVIDDRLIEANGYLGSMNKGEGYWIAQELIKHYQPKLPEDAVVLTKEEYDCLKKIEKAYDPFWFCTFGGCEGARKECKDTCEMSIFVQERRKTAKEVICNVKEMLKKVPIVVDYDGYGVGGIDYGYGKLSVDFCMNKLAKQYDVEVEE